MKPSQLKKTPPAKSNANNENNASGSNANGAPSGSLAPSNPPGSSGEAGGASGDSGGGSTPSGESKPAKPAFVIETVPVPASQRAGRECKYPVDVLEIGQSFFIPNGKPSSISSTVSGLGKKLKKTFIARPDKKEIDGVMTEGVRVFRVEYKAPKAPANPAPQADGGGSGESGTGE